MVSLLVCGGEASREPGFADGHVLFPSAKVARVAPGFGRGRILELWEE